MKLGKGPVSISLEPIVSLSQTIPCRTSPEFQANAVHRKASTPSSELPQRYDRPCQAASCPEDDDPSTHPSPSALNLLPGGFRTAILGALAWPDRSPLPLSDTALQVGVVVEIEVTPAVVHIQAQRLHAGNAVAGVAPRQRIKVAIGRVRGAPCCGRGAPCWAAAAFNHHAIRRGEGNKGGEGEDSGEAHLESVASVEVKGKCYGTE